MESRKEYFKVYSLGVRHGIKEENKKYNRLLKQWQNTYIENEQLLRLYDSVMTDFLHISKAYSELAGSMSVLDKYGFPQLDDD